MRPRGDLFLQIQVLVHLNNRRVFLKGITPTVDLVLGYKKSNKSPILKLLLSRLGELVDRVSKGEKCKSSR
jgi:hypothetical protein